MQVQDTIPRTLLAPNGLILPTIVDDQTPLDLFPAITDAFAEHNGEIVSRATLALVLEAVRGSSAIIILYHHGGQLTARCLWPSRVTLTNENALVADAYCTFRRECRRFRLDRILDCHALTTPNDIAA